MNSTGAVTLLVCVVVCGQGQHVSSYNNIKEEAKREKTDSVLNEILDELQFLRDAEQKNEEKMREHEDTIRKLQDENKNREAEISNLKEYSQNAAGSVAFMAIMNVRTLFPDVGEILPFNSVQLNLGLQYNSQDSVFTCPYHGIYLFQFSLYSGNYGGGEIQNRFSGTLVMDNESISEVYGYTSYYDASEGDHAASTAVVECPAGGMVWVECQYSQVSISGTEDEPRSTFMGYGLTFLNHP